MVDAGFSSMTEEWRKKFAERLSALLSGSALPADARSSVLKQLPKICAGATSFLSDAQELRERCPTLAPSAEDLRVGATHAAAYLESFVREAAGATPLTPESKAAALAQLKSLEQHAVRLIDERLVGDRPARDLVAQAVRSYFRDYEGDIGDPLRPFFTWPLSSEELAGVAARMSDALPAGKQYDVNGLGQDAARNRFLLNGRGVNDLIYQVAVIKMYLSVHQLSWVDPRNRESLAAAEQALLKWRDQIRRDLAERAGKPGIPDEARAHVKQLLEAQGAPEVRIPAPPGSSGESSPGPRGRARVRAPNPSPPRPRPLRPDRRGDGPHDSANVPPLLSPGAFP
jgi:hypothetical protein